MARSDYALCDLCERKVFYDADTDIPVGTVIYHPECAVKVYAEHEQRGYARAIAVIQAEAEYQRSVGRDSVAAVYAMAVRHLDATAGQTPGGTGGE